MLTPTSRYEQFTENLPLWQLKMEVWGAQTTLSNNIKANINSHKHYRICKFRTFYT
uniref:Alternative protein AQP4 n=1 Tax=Homo sapiens TaxID=9606 RepID=L0R6C7_HUMAN|nr:alternative protein AQP4 [Homo sapiens]